MKIFKKRVYLYMDDDFFHEVRYHDGHDLRQRNIIHNNFTV